MDEEERYERAKKRVEDIRGFYTHTIIYVMVNSFLFIVDLLTGGGWWFFWPLIGWGIGLTAHGVSIFGITGRFGSDWEERKIRELMDKDQRSRNE